MAPRTPRPRARDLGVAPGVFPPGPLNAITDVAGVRVGHTTIIDGDRVRTGVTAIVPHGGNLFQEKVPGAVFVGNAFGKLAGSTQVDELGTIETPDRAHQHAERGRRGGRRRPRGRSRSPATTTSARSTPLVGETNDGGLNDIRGQHVTTEHVLAAIAAAREGPVEEGSVGAGTGTQCFGWKGGIGTASRVVPAGDVALHARRAGADELRRRAHDRRRAGGQAAGPLRLRAVGSRRRAARIRPTARA